MKAIRVHEFGGPEVLRLEEVPTPQPGPGEVLIRMHAIGVNPVKTSFVRELMRDCRSCLTPQVTTARALLSKLATPSRGLDRVIAFTLRDQ